jgi:hypothetical protein
MNPTVINIGVSLTCTHQPKAPPSECPKPRDAPFVFSGFGFVVGIQVALFSRQNLPPGTKLLIKEITASGPKNQPRRRNGRIEPDRLPLRTSKDLKPVCSYPQFPSVLRR